MAECKGGTDLMPLFWSVMLVTCFVFSRGCNSDEPSNFDNWLEAHYGYQPTKVEQTKE